MLDIFVLPFPLNKVVQGSLSEEVALELRWRCHGKRVPGRGNSTCKDPEVEGKLAE